LIPTDRHIYKRVGYNNRIQEPGQVGKAVAESGTDDKDPESIAKAVNGTKSIVPIVL
jgi:hypothetical protein